MSLSVIIPAFNEASSIENVIKKTLREKDVSEIIIVNDGSKDNTLDVLKKIKDKKVRVFSHPKNLGKGAALITGLNKVSCDFVIIQDADLEYDPKYFSTLLEKAKKDNAIFGSRILGNNKYAYTRTYLGNVLVTTFYNLLFFKNLTDTYTCYKLIPTEIFKKLNLTSKGFEIEAEITGKLTKMGVNIIEVPIKYSPRKYQDGKKIKASDALKGLITYLKVRFSTK